MTVVSDWLPALVFAAALVAAGFFYWRFGARLFSRQSRALLGRETDFVRKTMNSSAGRFGVAYLPALFMWLMAGLIVFSVMRRLIWD